MPEVQDITGGQQDLARMRQQEDPNAMDAKTYQELLQKIQQQGVAGDKMQRQNIQQNIAMQQAINKQPTQMDLTPLMNFVDQTYGTHYAKGYQAPTSQAQKQSMVAKLQEEVMQATGKMTDDQTKLLKTQLETMLSKEEKDYKNQTLAAQREANDIARAQTRNDKNTELYSKHLETAQKGWQSDTIAQEAGKKKEEVGTAQTLLDDALTNPASAQEIPIIFARMAVPSRINEVELKAFAGSKKFSDRIAAIYTQAKTGAITKENHDYLQKILDANAHGVQRTLSERAALHSKQFSKVTKIAPEQAVSEVTGGTYGPDVLKAPAPFVADTGETKARYQVGQVINGYKFMGGDDTDQRNFKFVGGQ